MFKMTCKCGHSIRSHDWKLDNTPQPCIREGCTCKDFKEETSKRKMRKFIKRGIW